MSPAVWQIPIDGTEMFSLLGPLQGYNNVAIAQCSQNPSCCKTKSELTRKKPPVNAEHNAEWEAKYFPLNMKGNRMTDLSGICWRVQHHAT